MKAATVVLSGYGAGEGVATVIRDLAVAAYALGTRGLSLEVLVVDDGRSEAAGVASKVAAEYGLTLDVVPGPPQPAPGYVVGYQRVLARATADLAITLDATGQHDATDLPRLIDQLLAEDLDVLIGSRWARGSGTPGLSLQRWALGRLANRTFRLVTGIRGVTDVTTAFRIVRTSVLRQLDLNSLPTDPRAFQMAFVAAAVAGGHRVGEGPIIYQPPASAVSKVTGRDVVSFCAQLVPLRRLAGDIRRHRLSPQGRRFTDARFGAPEDLERLGTADRFFSWVLEEFAPYLDGRVLEVGAGLGMITRRLVQGRPGVEVVALEPAANVYGGLASFAALNRQVTARQQTLHDYLATMDKLFDAVLYLNVLEHIHDDARELRLAAAALRPGGALLVFGPALEWLYSELDHKAGHYRRYSVNRLRALVDAAGFEVVSLHYLDTIGVLPYFVAYRLLRRPVISGSTMWGYDRLLVPLSRLAQRLVPEPPFGKNVILVAHKR